MRVGGLRNPLFPTLQHAHMKTHTHLINKAENADVYFCLCGRQAALEIPPDLAGIFKVMDYLWLVYIALDHVYFLLSKMLPVVPNKKMEESIFLSLRINMESIIILDDTVIILDTN